MGWVFLYAILANFIVWVIVSMRMNDEEFTWSMFPMVFCPGVLAAYAIVIIIHKIFYKK